MICSETIKIQSRDYEYLKVDMYRAPLVMLKGKTGYVMCGYLNIEAAENLKDSIIFFLILRIKLDIITNKS